jgi:acetyl-CoA C-acetyltransferase
MKMKRVAIIGVGMTEFGELWDQSFRDLGIMAGFEALHDANITSEKIDAMYVGNMSAGRFIDQEHVGALVADYSGLAKSNVPSTRVEAGGASGALAVRQAFFSIASGVNNIVVVGGAEKMTDVGDEEVTNIQSAADDQEWETVFGATYPSLYALMAQRHMIDFGTTREMLSAVAVKNHRHGSLNPKAQFKREIKPEDVGRSPPVALPIRTLDCAPISDGAAAVVMCPLEMAKSFTETPVEIVASAQASDSLALNQRKSITEMLATKVAAKKAFEMAKILPKDVDIAEVHDNFTISEIMAVEDIGFFPKGQGGLASLEGKTSLNGEIAVNTSGGLKARGDPLGATGVAQIVEIVQQLRGKADKRQVHDAEWGLAQSVGGTGATVIVHILGVGK